MKNETNNMLEEMKIKELKLRKLGNWVSKH